MLNQTLLQKLKEDKPLGFTRNGGTCKYYMFRLGVSQIDWWDTLDHCIKENLIVVTGQHDATGDVYNWNKTKEGE